jgi:tetratricopeptide (TPR) repeat protein
MFTALLTSSMFFRPQKISLAQNHQPPPRHFEFRLLIPNMAVSVDIFSGMSMDELVGDISPLKSVPELKELVDLYLGGEYQKLLCGSDAQALVKQFSGSLPLVESSGATNKSWEASSTEFDAVRALLTGLAAFNAFIQANITGPPLLAQSLLFGKVEAQELSSIRQRCFLSLTTDGISVYQHIPHVELFCLARAIFTSFFPRIVGSSIQESRWMRIRINTYHQRLLSSGTSNARLSDNAVDLELQIEADLKELEPEVLGGKSTYSTEAKVQFLLEKAQIYIMEGLDIKARENVTRAKEVSEFSYALSGALGKRTKFQQTDISQLVVFAKSKGSETVSGESSGDSLHDLKMGSEDTSETRAPAALDLNDDTLLEAIKFAKPESDIVENVNLPSELAGLKPDDQPQLKPLDQIILLTEATIKDALSPLDKLNSEEILPFAVRVLSDKPTNWQIYTQALLVRSRIEAHRSRTQERSVLQLQAIVDQIIADTQEDSSVNGGDGIPQIQITQFLPRPKPSESAPITERVKYIYQLNSPTRWEIETELAYAWSTTGSLLSALEIFKRLQSWPEVALCYHSVGQEDRARQIIRRQLYFSSKGPSVDQYSIDAEEVLTEKWDGEARPDPPHAPRLWCILGDLDQDPECWKRAWKISKNRYARAQRTLGEYYTKQGDLSNARESYIKATVVNRQNNETWSRLGDIDLRVGNWDGAVIAFQQSIMIDDTDSKTYSNLGSALLSKHDEMVGLEKLSTGAEQSKPEEIDEDGEVDFEETAPEKTTPKDILRQALIAYKRGASIAYDNWKIWDNVITIAGRMTPPSFPDILMGLRSVIRIRGPNVGEEAVDIDILRALVGEVISRERDQNVMTTVEGTTIYLPARGSLARAVIELVDKEIIPLITTRAELWFLVEKLFLYRRDYAGALSCAEKAWRIATSGDEWLESSALWKNAFEATDSLVSAFENYGPQENASGSGEVEKGWKAKARSAIRAIMGKGKESWEDTTEYEALKERLAELKNS